MARLNRAKGTGGVAFNMTPMIDIVFNLIIFFMLVSQFQQLEIVEVELPVARNAQDKDYSDYRNVVINVKDPDDPKVVVVGKVLSDDISTGIENSELYRYLEKIKGGESGGRQLNVILRADAMIPYEDIARVMLCAGRAKIEGWWVTTEMDDEDTNQ